MEAIDEAVMKRPKQDLHTHSNYSLDPFMAEQICKIVVVAYFGDNLIKVINLCATYESYFCVFGGYLP